MRIFVRNLELTKQTILCLYATLHSFIFGMRYNITGEKMSSVENVLRHCDCGICGHFMEKECL